MGVPILGPDLVNDTTADAIEVQNRLDAIVAQMTGNIDRANLKNGEVLTAALGDLQVTGAKIADATVTAAKLAAGVALTNVADGSITTAKYADDSVTPPKLGLDLQEVRATAPTTLINTSSTTIGSTGVTATQTARYLVTGIFDFYFQVAVGESLLAAEVAAAGSLVKNGGAVAGQAVAAFNVDADNNRAVRVTVSQQWVVSVLAADILALSVQSSVAYTGTLRCMGDGNTKLIAVALGN